MTVIGVCEWLEGTSLAALIKESAYGFPTVVGIHIIGLVFSVGTLLWVDFRMLGWAMRGTRVSEVYRTLAPWFIAGFATMLVSGMVLFTAFATLAYANVYFRLKLVALLLAGANALAFHLLTQRSSVEWDAAARPALLVRAAGLASLCLWTAVIIAGRMMSYTMFSFPGG
jgi:hypothetical protein